MILGLLLPSILMTKRFSDRIFAPKPLFIELVNGLVDRGHTVYVYSAPGVETKGTLVAGDERLASSDLPSVRVREGSEESEIALQGMLTAYEYELDLTARAYAHAKDHGVQLMHGYQQFMAHYMSPLVTIPTVYTLHDPMFAESQLEGFRMRRFAEDNFVAISQYQAQLYLDQRVHIVDTVYHGVRLPEMSGEAGDKGYLLFLGRLIPEKGVLEAMETASRVGLPLHIGTSANYLTSEYAKRIELEVQAHPERYTFTGYLRGEALEKELAGARALLFPIQWDEPFGMVMIEAMACGTPVIAFNRGSVPEVIVDGVTGFIVEPESRFSESSDNTAQDSGNRLIQQKGVAGLVEAMQKIGQIDRAACRRHVEEHFTVSKMVEGYERVYQSTLSGDRR